MTPLQQHLEQMPPMPRPFNQFTPEAIAWHRALQWWVTEKARLERLQFIEISPDADIRPVVVPTRGPRPAWSGASADYMAQKKRESRARQGCRDCGKPRLDRGSRCAECQDRHDDEQAKMRSRAKSERTRLIREGLMERRTA